MQAGQKEKDSRGTIVPIHTLANHSLILIYYNLTHHQLAGQRGMGGGLDLVPDTQHPKESIYQY